MAASNRARRSDSDLPTASVPPYLSPAVHCHALGLLVAVSSLVLLSWRLTRPALWLDETASAIATERSWPNLWLLLHSPDAPIVPYYALLKALTGATSQLFPGFSTGLAPPPAGHLELLFRWPSVVACVLAAWLFTVWLARLTSAPVVLGAAVFLLASAGFSRYGQEARPYPFVVLLTVSCTVLWTAMVLDSTTRRRWLWFGLYAISAALMICANVLTATLIAAHLVASVIALERGRRRSALLSTVAAAAIGIAVVSPLLIVMVRNGKGASNLPPLSVTSAGKALIDLLTIGPDRWLSVSALLPLAVLGLSRVTSSRLAFVARVAAAWALVPLALWILAIVFRPNLLLGRYMLFVLPGWAILAGLGAVTVFELVHRVVRGRTSLQIAAATSWAVLAVLLAALTVSQLPSLQSPRTPGGHDDDIRPALALADSPRYANLPIFPTAWFRAVEVSVYDRRDEARLIGYVGQRDRPWIWPLRLPADLRQIQFDGASRMVLLLRVTPDPTCGTDTIERNAQSVYRCMPAVLRQMHYRVEAMNRAGKDWTFVVLDRGGEAPATPAQTRKSALS